LKREGVERSEKEEIIVEEILREERIERRVKERREENRVETSKCMCAKKSGSGVNTKRAEGRWKQNKKAANIMVPKK
jgi:hypothetical protein